MYLEISHVFLPKSETLKISVFSTNNKTQQQLPQKTELKVQVPVIADNNNLQCKSSNEF